MKSSKKHLLLSGFFLLYSTSGLEAAGLVANVVDPAGLGFKSTLEVEPVGGNDGTTLGQQRLNVLMRAFEILETSIEFDVPVVVKATFRPLQCTTDSGVLASTSVLQYFANFSGAPERDIWFPASLANQMAGEDLSPGPSDPDWETDENDEIAIQVSTRLSGDSSCLGGAQWYYGFDHAAGPNDVDLLVTLLHEINHGLGFSTLVNLQSGRTEANLPDVTLQHIFDTQVGLSWDEMSDGQRVQSATNGPNLVWNGTGVADSMADFVNPLSVFQVKAPAGIAGAYASQPASFGPSVPPEGLMGTIVLVDDGDSSQGATTDACEPLTNHEQVKGNLALIDRGGCFFVTKTLNAQQAGAIAVVVANNQESGLPPMGGSDPSVTIPSVGISMAAGTLLRNEQSPRAMLGFDFTSRQGTSAGFVRLHAPDPLESGSSVSHWTPDMSPDLLMEPSISPNLGNGLDLTLAFLSDIGWSTTQSDLILYPQLALGGGFSVVLTLTNRSGNAWQGEAGLFGADWKSVDWSVDGIGRLGNDQVNLALGPGETRKFVLESNGPATPGWLEVHPDPASGIEDLAGSFFYNLKNGSELVDSVGVPRGVAARQFVFPVEHTQAVNTGVAVRRMGGDKVQARAPIRMTLFDSQGNSVQEQNVELDAKLITEIFDNPLPEIGSVVVESEDSFYLVVLRIELTSSGVQLTSVPPDAFD